MDVCHVPHSFRPKRVSKPKVRSKHAFMQFDVGRLVCLDPDTMLGVCVCDWSCAIAFGLELAFQVDMRDNLSSIITHTRCIHFGSDSSVGTEAV